MSDIVETQPEVEERDLPEAATEGDLALADRLLAVLLVNAWLGSQQAGATAPGGLGQEQHNP